MSMSFQILQQPLVLTGVIESPTNYGTINQIQTYFHTNLLQVHVLQLDRRPESSEVLDKRTDVYSDFSKLPEHLKTTALSIPVHYESQDRNRGSWHEQTDTVKSFSYPKMNLVRICYSQWIDNPQKKIFNQRTSTHTFYTYSDLDLDLLLEIKSAGLVSFR